ncbi:MAG: hypothetical protein GEU96_05725 [Propionibacteriales bacterium]|nr:hypothetical protein [Propionibacteriales bacterium]
MTRRAFVSHDWLGPVAAAVVALLGLLDRPGPGVTLVVIAVVTNFGWNALGRTLISTDRLKADRRTALLRWVFGGQIGSVVAFWALLVYAGHPLLGSTVLVAGTGLGALAWPWQWRLEQAAEDRQRPYDAQLSQQHLLAAGILLVLALGSAVALTGVASALLFALVVSSLVDAWNERRRPRMTAALSPDEVPTVEIVEDDPEDVVADVVAADVVAEAPADLWVAAPPAALENVGEPTMVVAMHELLEPLDLPSVPLLPAPSPEPYVLFADEVAEVTAAAEPVAEWAPEPVAEWAPEPAPEPVAEPLVEWVPEPAPEPAAEAPAVEEPVVQLPTQRQKAEHTHAAHRARPGGRRASRYSGRRVAVRRS